jgi:hypothetical protein
MGSTAGLGKPSENSKIPNLKHKKSQTYADRSNSPRISSLRAEHEAQHCKHKTAQDVSIVFRFVFGVY